MAESNMQAHLQRLQEIMANSAPKPVQTPQPQHSSFPRGIPAPQHRASEPKDVTSITEWKPALKHVTRLFAANPQLGVAIGKMIMEHRAHEEQWWKERSKTSTSAELKIYDAKVYKAQLGMKKHMSGQLDAMGIPFFAPGAENHKRLELQQKMLEHLEDVYGPD